jgi:hypothetical protein
MMMMMIMPDVMEWQTVQQGVTVIWNVCSL